MLFLLYTYIQLGQRSEYCIQVYNSVYNTVYSAVCSTKNLKQYCIQCCNFFTVLYTVQYTVLHIVLYTILHIVFIIPVRLWASAIFAWYLFQKNERCGMTKSTSSR